MTNEELVLEYQNGNKKVFDKLIENNKGLRANLIRRFYPEAKELGISSAELEQELLVSLFEACKDYKFQGNSFFQYAYIVSKNKIINMFWQKRNNTVKGYKKDFKSLQFISINATRLYEEDDDLSWENIISDVNYNDAFFEVEESIDNEILKKDILKVLNDTFSNNIQQKILCMLYGIDQSSKDYFQVANETNMDVSQIIQIENSALKELRYSNRSRWFINKYGLLIGIERIISLDEYDNPLHYVQMKETVKKDINEMLERFERGLNDEL